ncbi:MAG: SAM-dependent methyltransferase [Holophagales bacterium]|jgi:SAM-dependent MidA family methyltransferase|nr:SAM-dependent methyltransferase [Holophagales bacterium]
MPPNVPFNPITETIKKILSNGSLPASEFMALALYHPEHGYYRRGVSQWGFDGKDYYTALDLGPLLGEAIAIRLHQVWLELDRPDPFTILEQGAGRGWLGRDLLKAATGDFSQSIRYIHCDDSPIAKQEALIALDYWLNSGQACLKNQSDETDSFAGAIISNELFDALPAQPWRWDGGEWKREVLISLEGEDTGLTQWEAAEPGEAGDWFSRHAEGGLQPDDGSIWTESLPCILETICKPMRKGLFLAIDYGDTAPRLIAKRAGLRRYLKHQTDGRWWEAPGNSDLTADVDLTRLTYLLERQGLRPQKLATLGQWICANAPLAQWEAEWQELRQSERTARKQNLMQLTLPNAMGDRFKVVQANL